MALGRPHVAQRCQDVAFNALGFFGITQDREKIGQARGESAESDDLDVDLSDIPWCLVANEEARVVRRQLLVGESTHRVRCVIGPYLLTVPIPLNQTLKY